MMQCIHKYVKASASNFDYDNIQIWFRNLKKRVQPQPHWKPNNEQMDELEKLIVWADGLYDENSIRTIESLYNNLKKTLNYEKY